MADEQQGLAPQGGIPRPRRAGLTLTDEDFALNAQHLPPVARPSVNKNNSMEAFRMRRRLYEDLLATGLDEDKVVPIFKAVVSGKVAPKDVPFAVETAMRNNMGDDDDPRAAFKRVRAKAAANINSQGEIAAIRRAKVPNRTVQWEVTEHEPVFNEQGQRTMKTVRRKGVSRNFNPITNDLLPEMEEIPEGARIIKDDVQYGPQLDTRARALNNNERDRAEARIMDQAIRLGREKEGRNPFQIMGSKGRLRDLPPVMEMLTPSLRELERNAEMEEEQKNAALLRKGKEIFKAMAPIMPGGTGLLTLNDFTLEQLTKTFVHRDPLTAYVEPKTPHERAFSYLMDGAMLAATGGGAGLFQGAKQVFKQSFLPAALEGAKLAMRSAIKFAKDHKVKAILKGAQLGFVGAQRAHLSTSVYDDIFSPEPTSFTPEEARKYMQERFPNVYFGGMTDSEVLEGALAISQHAKGQAWSDTIDSLPIGQFGKHLARGLVNSRYYMGFRKPAFQGSSAGEVLERTADRMLDASREKTGPNSFLADVDDYVDMYHADLARWNPDVNIDFVYGDKEGDFGDFMNSIANGVGFSLGIIAPYRAIMGGAGLVGTPITKTARAAARAVKGAKGAFGKLGTAGKELLKWGGTELRAAGVSTVLGMSTGALPVYVEGQRIYDEMAKRGYSPGQSFAAAYLVPFLRRSIEFYSEASFLPELGHNFSRGILRRIGKRMIMNMNPWEAAEEGLARVSTYGVEEAFGVPDEYREQKEAPYFGSKGLQEALGDLAMTTVASLMTGLRAGPAGLVKGNQNRRNLLMDKQEEWNLSRAYANGRAITGSSMRNFLKAEGVSGVDDMDVFDLQTEYYSLIHKLGAEEKAVFRNMIEQNIYGISNSDLAAVLGGRQRVTKGGVESVSGMEALAHAMHFTDIDELREYLEDVDSEWGKGGRNARAVPVEAVPELAKPPETALEPDVPGPETGPVPPETEPTGSSPSLPEISRPEISPPKQEKAPVSYGELSLSELKKEWGKEGLPAGDLRKKETWVRALEARVTETKAEAAVPKPGPAQTEAEAPRMRVSPLMQAAMKAQDEREAEVIADKMIEEKFGFDESGDFMAANAPLIPQVEDPFENERRQYTEAKNEVVAVSSQIERDPALHNGSAKAGNETARTLSNAFKRFFFGGETIESVREARAAGVKTPSAHYSFVFQKMKLAGVERERIAELFDNYTQRGILPPMISQEEVDEQADKEIVAAMDFLDSLPAPLLARLSVSNDPGEHLKTATWGLMKPRLLSGPELDALLSDPASRAALDLSHAFGAVIGAEVSVNPIASASSTVHEIYHFVNRMTQGTKEHEAFSELFTVLESAYPETFETMRESLTDIGYPGDSTTLNEEIRTRIAEAVLVPGADVGQRYSGGLSAMLGRASEDEAVASAIAEVYSRLGLDGAEMSKRTIGEIIRDMWKRLAKALAGLIGDVSKEARDGAARARTVAQMRAIVMAPATHKTAFDVREGFGEQIDFMDAWTWEYEAAPTYREYVHGNVRTTLSPHVQSVRTDVGAELLRDVRNMLPMGVRADLRNDLRDILISAVGQYIEKAIPMSEAVRRVQEGIRIEGKNGEFMSRSLSYKLVHRYAGRKFQEVVTPSIQSNGDVRIHKDVVFAEAPLAGTLGKEREMLSNYGFEALDPELDTAYVTIDGGNVYIGGRKTTMGKASSMKVKKGDSWYVSENFAQIIEAMASQGYYYLGPAGRNETFLFIALNPESVVGSGTALTALEQTYAALTSLTPEMQQQVDRIKAGEATASDLQAMVMAAFGTWMAGADWLRNPHKFFKYANTYASQEKAGNDDMAREIFSTAEEAYDLLNMSDLSPVERKRVERAFRSMYEQNENGDMVIKSIKPTFARDYLERNSPTKEWSLADRLAKDGYMLTPAGIAVKMKGGVIQEMRVVAVTVEHPWWYDSATGKYHTAEERSWYEIENGESPNWTAVGDGAGLNQPMVSVLMDVAMGELQGRVKIEKPRTLVPRGAGIPLLFKGQYQVADGDVLNWMQQNGVGKIMFSTTVKQGKKSWRFPSLSALMRGVAVPLESVVRLSVSSVSQAGSGELHDGHETSFAAQAIMANGFNTVAFPSNAELFERVLAHIKDRALRTRNLVAELRSNSPLRMALTRIGLRRESGDATVYGVGLESLLELGDGYDNVSQLPHFSAVTRMVAHKMAMAGLFDPRTDQGSMRTPGSAAFLAADMGMGSEAMRIVLAKEGVEGVMRYFEVTDALSPVDIIPFTEFMPWNVKEKKEGEEQKKPSATEEMMRKAVEKEAKEVIKRMAEAEGVTNIEAFTLRLSRTGQLQEVSGQVMERVMRDYGYTKVQAGKKIHWLAGPGFLKDVVEVDGKQAVPLIISRNVATNCNLKAGDRCMAIALPTDAPHSASAGIVVAVTSDHQTVTISPRKVISTGKDHDGDMLMVYGPSEGYWNALTKKPQFLEQTSPEEQAMYKAYAHFGHMELSEDAFDAIWDHFSSPEVRNYIKKLHEKVGLSSAFDRLPNGTYIGAKVLVDLGVVKPSVRADGNEALTSVWMQNVTADYVGRTAGAIGAVAATRGRIEFLIQYAAGKGEKVASDPDSSGLTPIERVYLANSLLTHHAVDVPKETAFFQYKYNAEEHTLWSMSQLFPNMSSEEVKKMVDERSSIYFGIRAAQTGKSNKGSAAFRVREDSFGKEKFIEIDKETKLTLAARIAMLHVASKKVSGKTMYEALANGWDDIPSWGMITAKEYTDRIAHELWRDVTRVAFPNFSALVHSSIISKLNTNRSDPAPVSPEAQTTMLGRLMWAYNNDKNDVPEEEHAVARLIGDTLGALSIIRSANQKATDDTFNLRVAQAFSVPGGGEVVQAILAHFADNLADSAGKAGVDSLYKGEQIGSAWVMSQPVGSMPTIARALVQLAMDVEKATVPEGGKRGVETYALTGGQMADMVRSIWHDVREALRQTEMGQQYLEMAGIYLASELRLDVQIMGGKRNRQDRPYMRIWDGTTDPRFPSVLRGGPLAKPEPEMAEPADSGNEFGALLRSPAANFMGLELIEPRIARVLGDVVADNSEMRKLVHDVEIPITPEATTDEDEKAIEDITIATQEGLEAIGRAEEVVESLNVATTEDGEVLLPHSQAVELLDEIKKLNDKLDKLSPLMRKALGYGGAIAAAGLGTYVMNVVSLPSDPALVLALPVIGASIVNLKAFLRKARAAFQSLYTKLSNAFPRLFELTVNGAITGYQGSALRRRFKFDERVGAATGAHRVWKGGKFIYSAIPTSIAQLMEASVRGAMKAGERWRDLNIINDICRPLIQLWGEDQALKRHHIELGIAGLVGLRAEGEGIAFDHIEFIPRPANGTKEEIERWGKMNKDVALKYVAEELGTGLSFDLRFQYGGRGQWAFNKQLTMNSPEIMRAAQKYGSVAAAFAVYESVRSIREFFNINARGYYAEMLAIEQARPTHDPADTTRKENAMRMLADVIRRIDMGDHVFPIGVDGGIWAEQGQFKGRMGELFSSNIAGVDTASDAFTALLIETALRRDDISGKAPGETEKRVIALEAMAYFINRGGHDNNEIEVLRYISDFKNNTRAGALLTELVSRRAVLDTTKLKIKATENALAEAQAALANVAPGQGGGLAKVVAQLTSKLAQLNVDKSTASQNLLKARFKLENEPALNDMLTRAYESMSSAFDLANRLAPSRVRLNAWSPFVAEEFVDLSLVSNPAYDNRGMIERPAFSLLSGQLEDSLSGFFEQLSSQTMEKQSMALYDEHVAPLLRSQDPKARASAMKFLRWMEGNFHYRVFAQPTRMDRLFKGEEVALNISFVSPGSGQMRNRTLRMIYMGKADNGRYEFQQHTPVGRARVTVDMANGGSISGVFRQQSMDMSIDIEALGAPYNRNKTARVTGVNVAVKDAMGQGRMESLARALEGANESWGDRFNLMREIVSNVFWTTLNVGAGVFYLGFNPASAVRNIMYPFRMMLVGNGWMQTKSTLEDIKQVVRNVQDNDHDTASTIDYVLNALPIQMFEYLQKGTGESDLKSLGSWKKGMLERIELLEMQAQAMITGTKQVKKLVANNPQVMQMTPLEREMYARELAVKEFEKQLTENIKGGKEFALKAYHYMGGAGEVTMSLAYKMFGMCEKFNRTTATVGHLIRASRFLRQDYNFGPYTVRFGDLPQGVREEVMKMYALKARREDERVNFDYSQIMRPAYMRHASGQLFLKFATFTQASYIWRKRDMQAGKADYRLLRNGKVKLDGEVMSVGKALRAALTEWGPNSNIMIDQEIPLEHAFAYHQGMWHDTIKAIIGRYGAPTGTEDKGVAEQMDAVWKQMRSTIVPDGVHASLQLERFRTNEFVRTLRLGVAWIAEILASTTIHFQLGILREPLSEFVSAFLDLISLLTGSWWDDEDETLWVDGVEYKLGDNPEVLAAKRRERDDIIRRLSFSAPFGGLILSKFVQILGNAATDPIVEGEHRYDDAENDNILFGLANMKGIGKLFQVAHDIFGGLAGALNEEWGPSEGFGEMNESFRDIKDALELPFERNWTRREYERQLEKARKAAVRGDYNELEALVDARSKTFAKRMQNEPSMRTFFGIKNLDSAERELVRKDAVRIQKAFYSLKGEAFDDAYQNALEYYQKKYAEILTGAVSKRQARMHDFVLGEGVHALYGRYKGKSPDSLPQNVYDWIYEQSVRILRRKLESWQLYSNEYITE